MLSWIRANMDYLTDESDHIVTDLVLSTAPSPSAVNNNETRKGAGNLGICFLLVNTTLGAGILAFPQAFDKAGGVGTSIIAQIFFLIFISAALVILAYCSDYTRTNTLQDTLAALCGKKVFVLCGICVILYSFGCCLTFLIIFGDQFDRMFATYYGRDFCHTWYLSRPFVAVIGALLILPLCFFKRLDILSYASSLGCVTIVYVTWLIAYKSYQNDNEHKTITIKMWPDNAYEVLQIVPVICFSYQVHMTAIPTYACMEDRRLNKFAMCAVTSMVICFGAYTVVGYFGYATFGIGKVPSDILQGYTDKSTILIIAIISVAVKNFTTYPIVLYCGRDALLGLFNVDLDRVRVRVGVTVVWFLLSLIIAILIPDISEVINLLGVLSATFIFVLPGICLLQSVLLKDPELHLNKDRLLIAFTILLTVLGGFVCGVVLVEAVQDLFASSLKPPLVTGFRQLKDNLCV